MKAKKVCSDWKKFGCCRKPDTCSWKHPGDYKGCGQKEGKESEKSKQDTKHDNQWDGYDAWAYEKWTNPVREKPTSSTDPTKACRFYAAGLCNKSHKFNGFIHNPTCRNWSEWGECPAGDSCLFPHRDSKGACLKRAVTFPSKEDTAAAAAAGDAGQAKQHHRKNEEVTEHKGIQQVATVNNTSGPNGLQPPTSNKAATEPHRQEG